MRRAGAGQSLLSRGPGKARVASARTSACLPGAPEELPARGSVAHRSSPQKPQVPKSHRCPIAASVAQPARAARSRPPPAPRSAPGPRLARARDSSHARRRTPPPGARPAPACPAAPLRFAGSYSYPSAGEPNRPRPVCGRRTSTLRPGCRRLKAVPNEGHVSTPFGKRDQGQVFRESRRLPFLKF